MTEPVYTYFVSFTYHWRLLDGTVQHQVKYGSLEIEQSCPVRRIEHVVDMQAKIRKVLDEQSVFAIAQDVIVLNYQLLRFAEQGVRKVGSPPKSRRDTRRASKRLRNASR